MNNTFSLDRFTKYLVFDLKNLWSRFGLGILVTGLFPVIYYLIIGIISSLTMHGWETVPVAGRALMFVIPMTAMCILYGYKTYGHLTERMAGSQWLLLPASRLEKFVSMMLITIVIVPFCFVAIYLLSDGLLNLVDPNYGGALINFNVNSYFPEEFANIVYIPAGGLWIIWASMIETIMVFLLGALVFKKGKVGKTVLALIILGMVFSWISVGSGVYVFNNDIELMSEMGIDFVKNLEFRLNLMMWLSLALEGGGCALAIWFRLKTLKH